ncbi:MAG TPA: S8 family serine peptidase, partial [Kofleriaceae bacterium]|nr:S8 family serine peptidase [Kofleriaceae bacterium]
MRNGRATAATLTLATAGALALGGCDLDTTVDSTIVEEGGPTAAVKFIRVPEPVPRRYIVVLDQPKDALARGQIDVGATADTLAQTFAANIEETWSAALHGFSAEMSEADALALADDPRVAFVQEDGIVRASGTQSGATWGLDRIDQADRPLSGSYVYPNEGAGVTAYIIDTGIKTSHSSFGGRAVSGHTSINDGRGSDDCNGHGTHVAGTVGSSTWGVAKNVRLVAVRVLGCNGSGTDSGVISGVNWVAQNRQGPSVANMSLGGGASAALDTAVRNAVAAGVTFVVAAGNENQNACNGSPSRVSEAITVGSSTSSDARSSFSNYGTCLDLFAPGSNITSANYSSTSGSTTMSGTSMAAPHVAGAAALYLAANPSATPAQVASALTGNASNNKLSSVGTGSPNKLLYVGFIGSGGGGGQVERGRAGD